MHARSSVTPRSDLYSSRSPRSSWASSPKGMVPVRSNWAKPKRYGTRHRSTNEMRSAWGPSLTRRPSGEPRQSALPSSLWKVSGMRPAVSQTRGRTAGNSGETRILMSKESQCRPCTRCLTQNSRSPAMTSSPLREGRIASPGNLAKSSLSFQAEASRVERSPTIGPRLRPAAHENGRRGNRRGFTRELLRRRISQADTHPRLGQLLELRAVVLTH